MKKSFYCLLVFSGLSVPVFSQQTPPIQPKTVDTPKLTPLSLSGPPATGQHIANAPLSADEAVRLALAHQPQITISKAAVDAAHGQVLQAQSGLLPSVAITAGGTRTQTLRGDNSAPGAGPANDVTTEIALNQLIFDFNKTRDQVRQAISLERAAFRSADQTQQDIAFAVKQDYYALVQAKQQVTVDTANVKSRKSQVDLTQAQLNAGLGAPADLVNAKTLLSQATLQLLQANQAVITSTVTLAEQMGIDPRTPIVLSDTQERKLQVSDSNGLVDQALKQRPAILAAQETLRAAGYGVSVARKTDAPALNFGAGVSTKGSDNPFDAQTGFISLTFDWTLIDGGLRLGRVRTAEAEKTSAAAQLVAASQSVISDVSRAYISLKAAEQQIQIAGAEVANAQEGVRLAEGRYKAGVTTFQEVITAQAELVTAQTDQVNAVASLSIAVANLDHAVGKKPS